MIPFTSSLLTLSLHPSPAPPLDPCADLLVSMLSPKHKTTRRYMRTLKSNESVKAPNRLAHSDQAAKMDRLKQTRTFRPPFPGVLASISSSPTPIIRCALDTYPHSNPSLSTILPSRPLFQKRRNSSISTPAATQPKTLQRQQILHPPIAHQTPPTPK